MTFIRQKERGLCFLIEEEMLVSVFDDIAVALYVEVQIESVVLVSYSDLSSFEYDFR